jgi:hypothetical protein
MQKKKEFLYLKKLKILVISCNINKERNSFLKNELREMKEEQKASGKLINKEIIDSINETNRMFKEVMEEFFATQNKKGFFRRSFGK